MVFCGLLVFALSLFVTQGQVCKTDSDCGSDECCYIEPEFLIASRREVPLDLPQPPEPPLPPHNAPKTGVCEGYLTLHQECVMFDHANGRCGCPVNMTCEFVPAQTVPPSIPLSNTDPHAASRKRGPVFYPGPGAYQCEYALKGK